MSRSRRSTGSTGAVRGPASALTSFLAGLGVEPSARLTTWGNSSAINREQDGSASGSVALAHDGPMLTNNDVLDPAGAVTARTVEAGPSQVGEGFPDVQGLSAGEEIANGTGKRRIDESATGTDTFDPSILSPKRARGERATSINSEDLDANMTFIAGPSKSATPAPSNSRKDEQSESVVIPQTLKAVGQFMECGECTKKFTVTAYTKEHPTQPSSWICVNCCYSLGIDPFAKAKKSAKPKIAAKREDRAKIVHYEQRKGVSALGDSCIQLIGKYIEDVEQLGDIGNINLDKVCKIISRSRRLNPETAKLFYSKERTDLAMYDCTRLVPESYLAMANLCPNLETLHLHLCGQLSTDAVISWGNVFKRLQRIELYGPFLVRKEGWMSFLKLAGKRLQALLVTQSPRIDLETIEVLVKSCVNLTELRLSEIGQLKDDLIEPLGKLKKLTILDLSSAGQSLTDSAVNTLLSKVGKNLVSLNMSDNPDLTDVALLAIATHCPQLRSLHLRNLVELTDDGVADFFATLERSGHPGFETIDLEKGHDLKSRALHALIAHSRTSLEKLSLMGWREVEKEALSELTECSQLRELDLGWCRQVTDFTIKDVLDACSAIKVIKVWGCNQLTDAVPRKRGVKVIGIETHTI